MKSLTSLLERVLIDMGTRCHVSTTRDCKTVMRRVEHEGLSFLTITLTNFGRDFERGLDQGFLDPSLFSSYKRTGGLPRFLGGFLGLVFDRGTGRLLDFPSIDAIFAVRQITLMFGKMKLPCTSARTRAAINRYVECEQEVVETDRRLRSDPIWTRNFKRLSALLWGPVLSPVDSDVYEDMIVPRHGPGATADRLKGNLKWNQSVWTERLEDVFPYRVHLCSSHLLSFERLDHVDFLEPETEIPVRVITVPKTLKTPRIIAIEPTCMQYMQQGIFSSLQRSVEKDDISSQIIGFSDQTPNQVLAKKGSSDGSLATLDLSEASDRVLTLHVELLLANHPHLREGVFACRSSKAEVPGHGVIPLTKFASMGSALTFPFEAMVFTTIVFMGIESALNRQLTKSDIRRYLGQVRVYGDDIIVPVRYVDSVVRHLELSGFKVNDDKSFWTGRFRESCGKEYYGGREVSISRVRTLLPSQRKHAEEIISTISLRNRLFEAGFESVVEYLDDIIERIVPFPEVFETSPILGKRTFGSPSLNGSRWCADTQRPLVRGVYVSNSPPASPLDDYGALLKFFSIRGETPIADEKHFQRAGRPSSVDIKMRWSTPY